jgi:predicted MPP superfamily phosphohydrolase
MKLRPEFIIILLVALAAMGYTLWHLWRLTPGGAGWKWLTAGVFVLGAVCMFGGFAMLETLPVPAACVVYGIGNTWLIAFLYLLLTFIFADLLVLLRLLPKTALQGSPAGFAVIISAVALLLCCGGLHYHHKYREAAAVKTDKPLTRPLRIVLASDLHLGYHNRRAELSRWVDIINAEHPDLVLLGGDLIDISVRPVLEGDYAAELRRLEAPVWTVLGNHEYYSNEPRVEQFLKDAGIRLLRDSVAVFEGITVIGRDDRTNRARKPLAELMAGVDGFTLLLDHQPVDLGEAEAAGIDFQFSGHTHRGQVWPISWVTDAIFENSWGHCRRGATQYYVSSGLGIWGAKIRIGSRSEYLVLDLDRS